MTPGPTRVPDRVLRAGARPMIHHRTPEFSSELAELLELIAPVFGTTRPVLPVHTTGRGAMEATICNLFSAGDEIAVCCNGRFGEMWARIAESFGLVVHRFATDWNADIDVDALARSSRIDVDSRRRHHLLRHVDRRAQRRGRDLPPRARARRAVAGGRRLVDWRHAFAFDEWGVDVAVTASQKCLMSSPGLAFVAVSDRAWRARATSTLPHGYWDFDEIAAVITRPRPETPGTPPVHTCCRSRRRCG